MFSKLKVVILLSIVLLFVSFFLYQNNKITKIVDGLPYINESFNEGGPGDESLHPLTIEALREGEYPGSDIVIEQVLTPGSNYQRYIASYKSEGLKIYGLLTVPNDLPPGGHCPSETLCEGGYSAVIFNHGYISPALYKTTEKYAAYQDAFARAGYVTFKSDYRGHGNSEGVASGGYGSNDYTIDVLNAVASLKKLKDPLDVNSQKLIVNSNLIGMWGHSMGGSITLKAMVVGGDIKAGVIWSGVVGSYQDLLERWARRSGPSPIPNPGSTRGRWRIELIERYGTPQQNPEFWDSISANSFLADISGPLQLHHGTLDTSVPVEFSKNLENQMRDVGKKVELFVYEGDDHNISSNLSLALKRSVDFFDNYLK